MDARSIGGPGVASENLALYPWWAANATTASAEQELAQREKGAFMIRPSSKNHTLVLSVHTADHGVQHTLVRADASGWHVTIGAVRPSAFQSTLDLLRFLNGYVRLPPQWRQPEPDETEYGQLSSLAGVAVAMETASAGAALPPPATGSFPPPPSLPPPVSSPVSPLFFLRSLCCRSIDLFSLSRDDGFLFCFDFSL